MSVQRDVSHLREVEADLVLEARVRALLSESIRGAEGTSSLEDAAQALCDGLASLPGIAVVHLVAFLDADEAVVIAGRAPEGFPMTRGDRLSPARARYLQERAASGPWGERLADGSVDDAIAKRMRTIGIEALAFGPVEHGDHVGGILVVGTQDPRFATLVADKMPPLVGFGASANTPLVERLHARRRDYSLGRTFDAMLESKSFQPVFQPIVELVSREPMGYEALTRFESGERPDACFADAWSVGRGAELELATLEAAVAAARQLPAGRWLNLNVSPRLLESPAELARILELAGRPIVLEITEHERIADYAAVSEAVAALGNNVRLAVDDAGVGIANFGHIVELRPDFVKLDISLIRGVNANLGRQALVIAMRHFALTAGCRLVAEGVETEDEARALLELGVEFGQGYWFGRPEPAERWSGLTAPTGGAEALWSTT
jgi:EAL domain-containing protein (putative c-di-GMP-specific phosphodiesterase class I)